MFFIFILFYFPIISKLKNNNFFGKYYLLLEKNVQNDIFFQTDSFHHFKNELFFIFIY